MTTPSPNPVESLRALPELLPCPFCGTADPNGPEPDQGEWLIWCNEPMNCDARISGYSRHNAIELWNRRPASAPDAELREALAALVEIDDGNRAAGSHRYEKGSETDKRWRRARKVLAKHSTAAEEGHG